MAARTPAAGSTRVVWSPALLEYDFGSDHPMNPLRLALTIGLAREFGVLDRVELVAVEPAPDEVLCTVHRADYVAAVRHASTTGEADPARGLGTADNPVFPGMHEAAGRQVAGSVDSALAVWGGAAGHAVNISGGMHHAMAGRASGFCVYNDAAAAVHAVRAAGARRVAYVDLDAHHGDGVEAAFWDDPGVLTISVHESGYTLFPGTGWGEDIGGPQALGSAVNVALPSGTSDTGWLRAVAAVVAPLLESFEPEMLISQHGCDAHGMDPLTNLEVSVDAQRAAMDFLHDAAHRLAQGRWLALGGGGYAIAHVVPRVWTHLLAVAAHAPVAPGAPVPMAWREHVERVLGFRGPARMGDGGVGGLPELDGADHDPADEAILVTRRAVFPAHGLNPEL